VASYLKTAKPKSKRLVLDANPEVQSKKALFEKAFADHYKGILEYRPNAELKEVSGGVAKLDFEDVKADAMLNATDPRFNPPIFDACLRARATYLDMAMTLSEPHPVHPHSETHIKLGDYQFAQEENWRQEGLLALVGIGIEPCAADVFAVDDQARETLCARPTAACRRPGWPGAASAGISSRWPRAWSRRRWRRWRWPAR